MTGKVRILVIDDEEIIRVSCQRILGPAGYEVSTSSDGLHALGLLEKSNFDIVLTDLKMPTMDGLEVMEKIKEMQPQAKVLIVTGYSTLETAVKAIKMGAFNYIEKPFTPESLIASVKEAVEETGGGARKEEPAEGEGGGTLDKDSRSG